MDRATVREIAHKLLTQHGLHRWTFVLKKLKWRLGQCEYKHRAIVLSEFFVQNNADHLVLDTILHEIAHALTPGHGHGPVWKAMARKIGATPKACCTQPTKMPPGRYQAACPRCRKMYHRHRKVGARRILWCRKCGREQGRLEFVDVVFAPLLFLMTEGNAAADPENKVFDDSLPSGFSHSHEQTDVTRCQENRTGQGLTDEQQR